MGTEALDVTKVLTVLQLTTLVRPDCYRTELALSRYHNWAQVSDNAGFLTPTHTFLRRTPDVANQHQAWRKDVFR
ncbi:hypothetical protein E2C01_011544 [Portunus trituberculatus]|uniref:Uncharacterized protein n=1 Tax=Portunus trituberculatus TaxID=210409 RepID=A0A5B7DBG8_PORTR|nr:hypothetical protein [Portunus trituberculatus]